MTLSFVLSRRVQRDTHERSRPWTPQDDALLRQHLHEGYHCVAALLNRTPLAVKNHLAKLRRKPKP